jgi:hypothetical protein
MEFDTYMYSGDLEHSQPECGLSPDETTGEASDVSSRILEFYRAGKPFYSKESIRDICRQLANSETRKVSVKGLDGVVVDFGIKTGQLYNTDWAEWQDFIMYVL